MIKKGSVEYYKIKISLGLAVISTALFLIAAFFAVFFFIKSRSAQPPLSGDRMSLTLQVSAQTEDEQGAEQQPDSQSEPEGTVLPGNPSFEYHTLYPEMYVEPGDFSKENLSRPAVYLTFDDGPSLNTAKVLDTLKENDAKATFFVVNNDIPDQQYLYKRIVDEGHTIAIHTYSHEYADIYTSVEACLEDYYKMFMKVYELTGVKPTMFRFAGGSINVYNRHVYQEVIAEMLRRGFTYYDWNVSSCDANLQNGAREIYNFVVDGVAGREKSIVLLHDSSVRYATAAALPDIINTLKEDYDFLALTNNVEPTIFTYNDSIN